MNMPSPESADATDGVPVEFSGASASPVHADGEAPAAAAVVEAGEDRGSQPEGAGDSPPRLPFTVVGVGASAGGLDAYTEFLQGCEAGAGIAYVLIQHLSPKHESLLAELLQKHTAMPVLQVEDGAAVRPDHVYVIRPGFTLTIRDGHLHLGESAAEQMNRRPIDDFFKSLAEEQRERAVAVILSGTGSNGTLGCESIKTVGGLCIAQEPESAKFPSMPRSLIDSNLADAILRPAEMYAAIERYAGHPYVAAGDGQPHEMSVQREHVALREVVAVLRAHTRHDFGVYKEPTLVRRIHRRMSLLQLEAMSDYVRTLRQTPAEVGALCDDLLIHVTGFFRDPEVWASLRERVIDPLVAQKPENGSLRCWVTACSSGEEAYTIGMLLLEASEAAGKRFDIKIFATDTAERSLSQARAGVFPGGIEGEITPARLGRFFEKTGAFYRVRKELRQLVVFAPHNVLQDPPFNRLDLCTCRNLLIYIEPPTQQRVLSMLHFALREGGTLVLGSSETIAGAEDLFEPIDKQHRIYRRVGPTRHGVLDYPAPRASTTRRPAARPSDVDDDSDDDGGGRQLAVPRATVAQLAARTLLARFTPAAVVVDGGGQIVHFHGDTSPFLVQPPGNPTREVLAMAREEVRGAVRAALQRAKSADPPARHQYGTIGSGSDRRRVEITAAPLAGAAGLGCYLVSFRAHPDPQAAEAAAAPADEGQAARAAEELAYVRDELQSTIEELERSNEEMRASHEEISSINEELKSTNEELETSQEELHSLNEELSTVNAQLQAKMEELERTGNDLGSLLSSTDIAVVFLDTAFRIRRFTPATSSLLDLIPGDAGRPIRDLAWKFDDAQLIADAQAVLERLVPIEREMTGHDGRHYVRRALPYRTGDDRIEGVVVTFVDVTERRRSEVALRATEEQFRRAIEDAPIPVIMQAEDGQVLQVSRTWTELTGYALADVPTADAWLTRAYGAGADEVRGHVHELFGGDRRTLDVEFAMRTRSGNERHWGFSASAPGTLRDGRRFLVGMAVDISERRRAEEALRASEAKYRALFDAIAEGLAVCGVVRDDAGRVVDLTCLDLNDACERQAGIRRDASVGRRLSELFAGADAARWLPICARVADAGEPAALEGRSASTGRWYAIGVHRSRADELSIFVRDVSERKRNKLRQAFLLTLGDALRPLADGAEIERVGVDLLGRELGASRVFYATLAADGESWSVGHDHADGVPSIVGRLPVSESERRRLPGWRAGLTSSVADSEAEPLFGVADRKAHADLDARAAIAIPMVKGGQLAALLCVHQAGPRAWAEDELTLAKEAAERIWAAIGRAVAERASRDSEARYQSLFAASPAPILVLKPDAPRFTIGEVNDAYLAAALRTREDVVGRGIFEAFPEDPADATGANALRASLERVLATRRPVRPPDSKYRVARPDGTSEERWWSPVHSPVLDERGAVAAIIHNANDVTETYRARAALRASEARLRRVFESNLVGMVRWDLERGLILDANDAFLRMTGYMRDDVAGGRLDVRDVTPDGWTVRNGQGIVAIGGRDQAGPYEKEYVRKDGSRLPLVIAATRFDDAPAQGMSLLVDISDRVQAERASGEVRQRIRDVLDSIAEGFALLDGDFTIVDVNEHTLRLDGRARDEIIGRSYWDAFPGTEGSPVGEALRRVARERGLVALEHEYRWPDGRTRWLDARAYPTRDAGIAIFWRDVTDRRRAEAALGESETKYRDLFDRIDEGFCIVEMVYDGATPVDYRFVDVNPAFERQSGIADATGRLMREIAPAHEQHWFDRYGEIATTGRPHRFEAPVNAFGDRWYEVNAFRVGAPERRRVAVVFNDVTERQRDAAALRASVTLYRALASNLPSGAAFVVDREMRYRLAGGEALTARGLRPEHFEGKTVREALSADLAEAYEPNYRRALAGEPFRHEHQSHGRWFVTHGVPLRDAAGGEVTGVLAVSYDVTDRKAAERRVDEGERRFGLVVQNLTDYAIFMLDPAGVIVGWWEGAERVTGYGHEAVGQHFRLFYPPELAGEPDRELRLAAAEGRSEVEGWRVHKDGSRYWVNEIVTAVHDAAGGLLGFAKIARDLTERKQVEQELTAARDAAEQASRVKDDFLATLSHELRTPLSAILIWSKLLGSSAATDRQRAEGLAAIQSSAESQKQLIDDMLDSSRIAAGQLRLDLRPIDLRAAVASAIETIRPTAEAKGLTVVADLADDVEGAIGDPDRVRQIVWNLLSNAVKFTPDDGRIDVALRRADGFAVLSVRDAGRGIAPEFLPRVFQRFLQEETGTTRRSGGLGLGLSIVRQLVELHNGVVEAHSEGPGKGSTFTVRLPLARGGRRVRPRGAKQSRVGAPVERPVDLAGIDVLLVEDEPTARRATAQLLAAAGAHVEAVDSARAAMASLGERMPDVLVSDIGMPDEDGLSLLKRVRASGLKGADKLPAIAVTAYAHERDADRARAATFQRVIVKPFQLRDLADAIVAAMASADEPASADE